MKCSNVRKEIERLAYQDGSHPGAEVYLHIDSCKACARYLEETSLAAGKIAGLRRREPFLENPEELTEDIMKAIREDSNEMRPALTGQPGKLPAVIILQRLLAAASVCFFLLFAYEEYIVVDKISRLEKQNAAISQNSQYQAALKLKKVISFLAADPEMRKQFKESKTGKINLKTLLRAAMYADMTDIAPDLLKLLNRTDKNASNPHFSSILKQFDSTIYKIQR